MATRRELERMAGDTEAGDALSAAALRDAAEEAGGPAARAGDWQFILTATFYFLGRVSEEDHEYYHLAPGSWLVYDTGPLAEFFRLGRCKRAERIAPAQRVRKGPTISLVDWPHGGALEVSEGA